MTAADAKWSYERALHIQGNPSFLLDGIDTISAPDDQTLVIAKKDQDPSFIAKSIFGVFAVLDSKVVKEHGGTNAADAKDTDKAEEWLNQNSAGTGPYVLKKWIADTEVDFERFGDYWKGNPPFESLVYRNPSTLEVCALLTKPDRRKVDLPTRYVGFEIPDRFVVGYGLDYGERHRNLPFVAALER